MNFYENRPRKNKIIEEREFQVYVKRRNFSLLFHRLLEQYITCRSRVQFPVSCSQCDPDAKKPLNPFLAAQFAADFEQAVKAALGSIEMENCFDTIEREQLGSEPDAKYSLALREQVVERVGKLLVSRGITKYFVRVKK
jgi:hypothetical protein